MYAAPSDCSIGTMTTSFVKLKVGVVIESEEFRVEEFHDTIKKVYNVGYIGIFKGKSDAQRTIYIQGGNRLSRMASGKVKKLILPFVQKITSIDTFKFLEGTLVTHVGKFRTSGPKIPKQLLEEGHKSKSADRFIHVHIHSFGNEDISHITAEKIEELAGNPREKIAFMDRNFHDSAKKRLYEKAWNGHRKKQKKLAEKWKRIQFCLQVESGEKSNLDFVPEADRAAVERVLKKRKLMKESSGCEDEDEDSDSSSVSELSVRSISSDTDDCDNSDENDSIYDSDCEEPDPIREDDEYIRDEKKMISQGVLLLEHAKAYKLDFMIDFFELLLSNPRNANLKGCRKDGYRFFDNGMWVKKLKSEFGEDVSDNIVSKSLETLKKARKYHMLGKMSLFAYKYSKRIIMTMKNEYEGRAEKDPNELADYEKMWNSIDGISEKIKKIERIVGKKMKRIDESEFGFENLEVSQSTNWEDFLSCPEP